MAPSDKFTPESDPCSAAVENGPNASTSRQPVDLPKRPTETPPGCIEVPPSKPTGDGEWEDMSAAVIDADAIRLYDQDGKVCRAYLGPIGWKGSATKGFGLFLRDHKGRDRLQLMITTDGTPSIALLDEKGAHTFWAWSHKSEGKAENTDLCFGCGGDDLLRMGIEHYSSKDPLPFMTMTDSDQNTIAEIGGRAGNGSQDPYYHRVVLVEVPDDWQPGKWDDVPESAKVLSMFDNSEETFDAAVACAYGHNQAALHEKEKTGNAIEVWAAIVAPDAPVKVGSYGRRRPGTFCTR